jgi:hypothetical protein
MKMLEMYNGRSRCTISGVRISYIASVHTSMGAVTTAATSLATRLPQRSIMPNGASAALFRDRGEFVAARVDLVQRRS